MAATVQLVNDAGEKVWRYSVDAKELLATVNPDGWKMAGPVKLSGWATPSKMRAAISPAASQANQQAAMVAKAVTDALVEAQLVHTAPVPDALVTDEELDALTRPTGEESAGLNEPDPKHDHKK